jgi:tRNA 5-methylaminomethyl-2-thiouridine biosynthesis bifunctional protein
LMAATGVLQIVGDELEHGRWDERLQRQHWPTRFVRWYGPAEAREAVGLCPSRGGLWFEGGAVVSPATWCRALLGREPRIRLYDRRRAIAITRQSSFWSIEGQSAPVATAPVVVVASAMDAPPLLRTRFTAVRPIRGRITHLAAGELAGLRAGVTGLGYVLPGLDGRVAVGATYETSEPDHGPGLTQHAADEINLQRLSKLLATCAPARIEGGFEAIRCVSADRMPLAGAVADEQQAVAAGARLQGAHLADLPRLGGLYCNFALGSRGLTLAPLLGELVASLIEGEPPPLERSLASTVDPARFLLRRLRSGRNS